MDIFSTLMLGKMLVLMVVDKLDRLTLYRQLKQLDQMHLPIPMHTYMFLLPLILLHLLKDDLALAAGTGSAGA